MELATGQSLAIDGRRITSAKDRRNYKGSREYFAGPTGPAQIGAPIIWIAAGAPTLRMTYSARRASTLGVRAHSDIQPFSNFGFRLA